MLEIASATTRALRSAHKPRKLIMKKLIYPTAVTLGLGAGAVGFAAAAEAGSSFPYWGSSAADTIKTLQGQGYSVQINGTAAVPLSRCTTSGVHGLPDPDPSDRVNTTQLTTVYVDISCPDNI
jgi:hypothetical protein